MVSMMNRRIEQTDFECKCYLMEGWAEDNSG
jgi:hypothetical protein